MVRLALIPGLLTLASVALAGQWQVTYSGGRATVWIAGTYPYTLKPEGYGGGGSAASGTITAKFTWVGSGNPTPVVYVREWCSAWGTSFAPAAAPTANNGLGSEIKTTTTIVPPQTSQRCTGERVSYRELNGARTFEVTASPSASGESGCSVLYSAAVTNFGVYITSNIEESFHKGPNNTRVSNSSAGILTPREGDTWADPDRFYEYWDPLYHKDYVVKPTFYCNHIGQWRSPFHSWNCDPTPFVDTLLTEYESVSPFWWITTPQYEALAKAPMVKTIKLNVTSSDGGAASAVYKLRIHHPYEHPIMELLGTPTYERIPLTVDAPGYAYPETSVGVYLTYNYQYWSMITGGVAKIKVVVSNFANPAWKPVLGAALFMVGNLEKTEHLTAPWGAAWGDAFSRIEPGNWSSDPELYVMFPLAYERYQMQLTQVDRYGPNGYSGLGWDRSRRSVGWKWAGHFVLWTNRGGGDPWG